MLSNEQVQLSRRYIAYKTLINLWFMGAVWLYFYRLFINDQQVGILDGLAFAIGIIAEVPSGALADRFGRDRLVRLGLVLAGLGLLIQAAGSSFLPFFLGQSMMMVGIAFISGADEALFYDRLGFDPNSTHWRKLVTRGWQVALMGILVANVTGGWLHTVNPRIPWILTGLAFMAATALIWTINDPRTRHARRKLSDELATYFSDIKL